MKRFICVLFFLVALVSHAIAEYSFTQEFEAGSYIVYLPLTFEQWGGLDSFTSFSGNLGTETHFAMDIDKMNVDQIDISFSIDDPIAEYSTSGDVIGLWNNLLESREHSFKQADECIAVTVVDNGTYTTTAQAVIINGKDFLGISVMSKSHDRALELLDGILDSIVAKELHRQ